MFFDRFVRRVEIAATLHCDTALRIGAGRGGPDTLGSDLPILRTAGGEPVIPGSSLKGVVRSSVESVVRGLVPGDARRWACDPLSDRCFSDEDERDLRERKLSDAKKRARERRDGLRDNLCRICRTFGAPGLASHVTFRDATVTADTRVERRDGVAIDRDLGKVSGNKKYDFEVVPADTRFRIVIAVDSAELWQEGLLVLGLDLLDSGFARLGGMTSRGLGKVTLEGHAVRVIDVARLARGDDSEVVEWPAYRDQARGAWKQYLDNNPRIEEGAAC